MLDDLPNVTQLKGVEPGFKRQLRSSRIYGSFFYCECLEGRRNV